MDEFIEIGKLWASFGNGTEVKTMNNIFSEISRFIDLNYDQETKVRNKNQYLQLYKKSKRLWYLEQIGLKKAPGCRSCSGYTHYV